MSTTTQQINEIIVSESEIIDSVNFAELIAIGLSLTNNESAEFEHIMLESEGYEQPSFE